MPERICGASDSIDGNGPCLVAVHLLLVALRLSELLNVTNCRIARSQVQRPFRPGRVPKAKFPFDF